MSTEVQVVEQQNFEVQVKSYFSDFETQAKEWLEKAKAIQVTDVSQKQIMKDAREARLILSKIRIQAEAKRKELKEEFLKKGQLIDKTAKTLIGMIEPIEEVLQGHEDFAKNLKEKERQELHAKRLKIAAPLLGPAAEQMNLSEMDEDVFNTMIDGYKLAKAEKDKKDKELADLKLKADADAKAIQDAKDKELEVLRLANQSQQDQLKKFQEEEAANKLKEENEKKAQAKLRRAPDKDKLLILANQIEAIGLQGSLKDEEAQKVYDGAKELLGKVVKYIRKNADDL